MAKTLAPVTLFAGVSCGGATPGTRAAPSIASAWQDMTNIYGGNLSLRVVNGSSGPGALPIFIVQWSPDNGSSVYDFATFSGADTMALSDNSAPPAPIWIDQGVGYVRVIGFGNTTNAVTVYGTLSKITGI